MAETNDRTIEVLKTALLVNPKDPAKHFMLGQAYRGVGQLTDAVGAFRKAVSLKPDHTKALYHLGLTLEELGETAAAAEAFERCVAVDGANVDARLRWARARALLAEHAAAAAAFESVLRLEPGHTEATRGAFDGWHNAGEHPKAAAHVDAAQGLEADSDQHSERVAVTLEAVGRAVEARTVLEALAQRESAAAQVFSDLVRLCERLEDPRAVIAHAVRSRALHDDAARHAAAVGRAHFALGAWSAAAPELKHAAEGPGSTPVLQRDAAIALRRAGHAHDSLDGFRVAASSLPGDVLLLEEWARARMQLDRHIEALELLREAVALPTATARTHVTLAECHEALGNADHAERAFAAAVAIDPNDPVVQASLGRNRLAIGNRDGAIDAFERSTLLDGSVLDNWLSLGAQLLDAGRADEALRAFDSAIEVDPASVEALRGKSLALVALDHVADGIVASERWSVRAPGVEALGTLGQLLLKAGRNREAVQALETALGFGKTSVQVGLLLSAAYQAAGRSADARIVLEPVHAAHPANVDVLRLLAELQLSLREPAKAVETMRTALRYAPNDAGLHALSASAQLTVGNEAGAIASFEQALWLDPENPKLRIMMGETLRRMGRTRDAISSLRAAVHQDPSNARGHFELGWAMEDDGDAAGAAESYSRCIGLDANSAGAHFRLGLLQQAAGKLKEAAASLGKAVELEPDFAEAHMAGGEVLEAIADLDGALFALRSALRLSPEHTPTLLALARIYAKSARPHDAVPVLEQALQQDPSNSEARLALSRSLTLTGRRADALSALQRLVEDNPQHAEGHREVANHYKAAGSLPEAIRALESACRAAPTAPLYVAELAQVLFAAAEHERALMAAQRAAKLGDASAEHAALLGRTYAALNEWDAAAEALEPVLARAPTAAAAETYAQVLLQSRAWARAARVAPQVATFAEQAPSVPLLLGWVALHENRAQAALQSFEAALRVNPDDHRAAMGAGLARAALGQHTLAIPLLRRAPEQSPAVLEALGCALLQDGNIQEGVVTLERVSPLSADAGLSLLWAYRNAGRTHAFEHLARQLLRGTVNDAVAAALGEWQLSQGQHAEVVSTLGPLDDRLGARGLSVLGRALSRGGDHRMALHRLRRAASLAPLDAVTSAALGVSLVHEAQVEEGLRLLESAFAAGVDDVEAHRTAATGYRAIGQHARAGEAMQAVLRHNPADHELRYECGLALHRAGQHEEAMSQYRALRAARPALAERLFREMNR